MNLPPRGATVYRFAGQETDSKCEGGSCRGVLVAGSQYQLAWKNAHGTSRQRRLPATQLPATRHQLPDGHAHLINPRIPRAAVLVAILLELNAGIVGG